MFGGQIFFRRSRFHDLQEAGGVGDLTGRTVGAVAKFTSDWLSDLLLQPAGGKNLMVGWLLSQSHKQGKPIGILEEERLKHLHIEGPTGTGKTTQLANLILQDIYQGSGIGVIDVQGDLTPIILSHIPPERLSDVIVLDVTDTDYPFGFNILEAVGEKERSRTTGEVVSIFEKTVGSLSWGPRLEYILRIAIMTLLCAPETTLMDLRRLLMEPEYRLQVLTYVTDPMIHDFWLNEFESMNASAKMNAIGPILNKVGPWLTYPEIRNIIGQPKSTFNLRTIMDEGQILIIKLTQGNLSQDVCGLIGALIVSKIQMVVMSRADLPPSQRRPFYLYIDEFQNFVTDSFKKILTEARAFGLGVVLANQYSEQLSPDLMLALEKNVAVKLTCKRWEGRHIVWFEDMHEYDRPIYTVKPLPPIGWGLIEQIDQLYEASRVRYGRPKQLVETYLKAQFKQSRPQPTPAKTQKAKSDFTFAYEEG